MYTNPTISKFDGIIELENQIRNLDRAIEFPVHFRKQLGEDAPEFVRAKENTAVYNLDRHKLAKIFTDRYTLLQHQNAFGLIAETLKDINMTNVSGFFKSWEGNAVKLFVTFNDMKIADDSEQGLKLGFTISNSYNGWSAFSGKAWAYRSVCENGMVFGKVIPEALFWKKHSNQKAEMLTVEIHKFMTNLIHNCSELQTYVNEAMKDTLEWQYAENILKIILQNDVQRKKLENKLRYLIEEHGSINRYDLYNEITHLATHGERISYVYEQYLQKRAEQLLTCSIPELKVKPNG